MLNLGGPEKTKIILKRILEAFFTTIKEEEATLISELTIDSDKKLEKELLIDRINNLQKISNVLEVERGREQTVAFLLILLSQPRDSDYGELVKVLDLRRLNSFLERKHREEKGSIDHEVFDWFANAFKSVYMKEVNFIPQQLKVSILKTASSQLEQVRPFVVVRPSKRIDGGCIVTEECSSKFESESDDSQGEQFSSENSPY